MSNETQEQKKTNWTAIDPQQLLSGALGGLFTETVNIDAKGDAFAQAAPVDDGKYAFILGPSADPNVNTVEGGHFDARAGKPATDIIKLNLSLTIAQGLEGQDPAKLIGKTKRFDKSFSTATKIVNGVATSEIATILKYLGADLSAAIASGQLTNVALAATLLQSVMSGTAQIGGSTVWKGGYKEGKERADGSKEFGKFLVVGQKNFPLAPGGKPGEGPYLTQFTKDGVEIRAKAYLRNEFFSLIQNQ